MWLIAAAAVVVFVVVAVFIVFVVVAVVVFVDSHLFEFLLPHEFLHFIRNNKLRIIIILFILLFVLFLFLTPTTTLVTKATPSHHTLLTPPTSVQADTTPVEGLPDWLHARKTAPPPIACAANEMRAGRNVRLVDVPVGLHAIGQRREGVGGASAELVHERRK